jgi:hypothetical protein
MVQQLAAGAGFLLAVLWFDLMFDVQVLGHHDDELPPAVLASIAAYYGRVTTRARPMNRLVALAMVATIAAVVAELVRGSGWAGWASLGLVGAAVALAAGRTLPNAIRLGAQHDPPARQSELARAILRDHVCCLAAIATLLALQLSTTV